ncbi:exodeoxyribonuclease III [Aureococcus anophagefferens]|nr:exodeoxyribonuclease III [Aureococcus anophagefferens]
MDLDGGTPVDRLKAMEERILEERRAREAPAEAPLPEPEAPPAEAPPAAPAAAEAPVVAEAPIAPTPLLLVDLDALLAVDLEDIGAMSCAERADVLSDALFVHARVTRSPTPTTSGPAPRAPARALALGIGLAAGDGSVDLRWLSDAEAAARGDQPQTGDGKWSEWVEYLAVGDEVDLVPRDVAGALEAFGGAVRGVTRRERPPGAQPLLKGSWTAPA